MNYPKNIIGTLYSSAVLDKPCTLNLVDGIYYSEQFKIAASDLDFTEFESRSVIRGHFANIGEFAIMPQFPNKTF